MGERSADAADADAKQVKQERSADAAELECLFVRLQ